ncbi:MFS transporter (plasmid) [Streptomyces sp. BI20]|uniref:MFS transporter n=1 Tax=Streptomyces sp. BI20 TaxID=3403460 RepID=UPI003C7176E9
MTASLAAIMFLSGFAALAVMPVLPSAARDLDGVRLYPLVAGAFVAASLLGGVLGGAWVDRDGPRRPLVVGMALTVVTLLVSATSTTIWQLALGRFTDGIAAGLVAVAVNTAVGRSYPERLRPRALSFMSACWIVPSLLGPPPAGLVAAAWSWRVVFWAVAALVLVPAVVAGLLLRDPVDPPVHARAHAGPPEAGPGATPRRPSLGVAVTVSVAAALTQYGVSAWNLRHLLCTTIGVTALLALAPRLLPPRTTRAHGGLPATVLLRALISGTFFTLESFVPLMLSTARPVPAVVTGLGFTGAALAWAAGSLVQGRVGAGVPRHRLVAVGAGVMAVAVAIAALCTLPVVPPALAVTSMATAAFGMGLAVPSLTLLSLAHSPADRQGHASGAMQTAQNLGQTLVLALASALFTAVATIPGTTTDAVTDAVTGVTTDATTGGATGGSPAFAAAFALLLLPVAGAIRWSARTRLPNPTLPDTTHPAGPKPA